MEEETKTEAETPSESEKPPMSIPELIYSYSGKQEATNKWGDNMKNYIWDGPEDSDEELEELTQFKNDYEEEMGIKYSKKGIIQFIENFVRKESRSNKEDVSNAKLWEEKVKSPGLTMYIKKGGSHLSSDQPFVRSDINFPSSYKMEKILGTVSTNFQLLSFICLFRFSKVTTQ